jgi:hypothetical protein
MQVDIYFEYFEAQSMLALKNWGKYNISSLKFHHVTDIARMIKQECTRVEIESFLTEILTGECKSISSEVIDLTVRLLLMVPNWSILTGASADETTLTWMDGTVSKAFTRHFRQRNASKELMPIVPSDQGKVDKTLTARNIEEIGGLKIVWTSNLLDHLQLRKDRRSVEIFHHASFLHYQAKSEIYPKGLLDETVRTLSLLLPSTDSDTKDWFSKYQIQLHLDPEAIRCPPLKKEERNLDKFEFWNERLGALKQAYDEAKPAEVPKSPLRKYFSGLSLRNT